MHYVWSRWPAWSGSSRDRLRCNALCRAAQAPTLSGISPAAIIAYFSGTCKPRRRFPPPFSATFDRPHRSPMGPFTVGFHRRFPWTATLSGLLPLFFVGRFQPPSPSPDWDFRRFPLCGPLSRTAAEIFTGFLWGNEGAMEAARRRLPPLLGRLCFLSVIDGVAPYQNLISDETAWIKAVSLVFLRSIAWHRAAAPVVCGSN